MPQDYETYREFRDRHSNDGKLKSVMIGSEQIFPDGAGSTVGIYDVYNRYEPSTNEYERLTKCLVWVNERIRLETNAFEQFKADALHYSGTYAGMKLNGPDPTLNAATQLAKGKIRVAELLERKADLTIARTKTPEFQSKIRQQVSAESYDANDSHRLRQRRDEITNTVLPS